MRIIAGTLKRKKLATLPGNMIRPTSDRVRESIFSICTSKVQDATVLDLFSGTGAFAIESLSRGARFAVLIDSSIHSIAVIEKNIKECRLNDQVNIIRWNILTNLNCLKDTRLSFDLVFMDPPYDKDCVKPTLRNLTACNSLCNDATVIIEHSKSEVISANLTQFKFLDQRKYGKTLVSFLNYMIKEA